MWSLLFYHRISPSSGQRPVQEARKESKGPLDLPLPEPLDLPDVLTTLSRPCSPSRTTSLYLSLLCLCFAKPKIEEEGKEDLSQPKMEEEESQLLNRASSFTVT